MAGTEPRRGFLDAFARAVLWPLSRFFDPRFRGLAQQADLQHDDLVGRIDLNVGAIREVVATDVTMLGRDLNAMRTELVAAASADLDSTREANELIGRSVGDLLAEATFASMTLEGLANSFAEAIREDRLLRRIETATGASVDELGEGAAQLLNYASSHRGFAAQRRVWFNPPLSLSYEAGDVRPSSANERLVEVPYVYRALARTEPEASVLDVGAAESIVAYSLASLGYRVTALDLNPYPLEHPGLRSVEGDILNWDVEESFDAVLCISTLEHIGLGVYGGEPAPQGSSDQDALERIWQLTRPGGMLVLTVPFGPASADETQRSYERAGLKRLLRAWTIEDFTVARQQDDLTWLRAEAQSPADDARSVALITALRPAGSAEQA